MEECIVVKAELLTDVAAVGTNFRGVSIFLGRHVAGLFE